MNSVYCVKQVPLVYVLMSRIKTKDYVAVLSALRSCMATVNVKYVTSDCEKGLWRAIASVFTARRYASAVLAAVSYTHLTLPTNREV